MASSRTLSSRPVSSGWKPVLTSSRLPTRPLIRTRPSVGSVMRLRIFSKMLFPTHSFTGQFPAEESASNGLLHLVKWDIEARLRALRPDKGGAPHERQINTATEGWKAYLSDEPRELHAAAAMKQWPPDRDGWLRTMWDQGGPFSHHNNYCPYVDPDALIKKRSVVGCVATATAQIVNYWKHPATIEFSSEDEYWSNGDAGLFNLDAHHLRRGFPSFVELSDKLDRIDYSGDVPPIVENAVGGMAPG
jgi:hypothetical protein